MKKSVSKPNKQKQFDQENFPSILDLAAKVNTPEMARAFREALPDHPLSRVGRKSERRQKRAR